MAKITDPDLLKQLNAPQQGPPDPGQGDVSGTVQVANPSVGDYARSAGQSALKFGKGLAQSGAQAVSSSIDIGGKLGEGKVPVPFYGDYELPPMVGAGVGAGARALFPPSQLANISKLVPGGTEARDAARDFAKAPSTSTEQTVGYWSGEAAQAMATGAGSAVGKAGKLGMNIAGNEIAWEGAKQIGAMLGTDHIWPIFLAIKAVPRLFGRGGASVAKKGAEKAVEEAPKAAETAAKAAPKGPVPGPAKPPAKPASTSSGAAPATPPEKRTTKLPGQFPWRDGP